MLDRLHPEPVEKMEIHSEQLSTLREVGGKSDYLYLLPKRFIFLFHLFRLPLFLFQPPSSSFMVALAPAPFVYGPSPNISPRIKPELPSNPNQHLFYRGRQNRLQIKGGGRRCTRERFAWRGKSRFYPIGKPGFAPQCGHAQW